MYKSDNDKNNIKNIEIVESEDMDGVHNRPRAFQITVL